MVWQDTDLKWIMPSPNMPLPETTHVYPGQVVWEGTNLSEGRGTCRPFEIFGAPFLDIKLIKQSLLPKTTTGCYLQEISFRPTFNKWKGELCHGFMIHILDHFIRLRYTGNCRNLLRHGVPPLRFGQIRLRYPFPFSDTRTVTSPSCCFCVDFVAIYVSVFK